MLKQNGMQKNSTPSDCKWEEKPIFETGIETSKERVDNEKGC